MGLDVNIMWCVNHNSKAAVGRGSQISFMTRSVVGNGAGRCLA